MNVREEERREGRKWTIEGEKVNRKCPGKATHDARERESAGQLVNVIRAIHVS